MDTQSLPLWEMTFVEIENQIYIFFWPGKKKKIFCFAQKKIFFIKKVSLTNFNHYFVAMAEQLPGASATTNNWSVMHRAILEKEEIDNPQSFEDLNVIFGRLALISDPDQNPEQKARACMLLDHYAQDDTPNPVVGEFLDKIDAVNVLKNYLEYCMERHENRQPSAFQNLVRILQLFMHYTDNYAEVSRVCIEVDLMAPLFTLAKRCKDTLNTNYWFNNRDVLDVAQGVVFNLLVYSKTPAKFLYWLPIFSAFVKHSDDLLVSNSLLCIANIDHTYQLDEREVDIMYNLLGDVVESRFRVYQGYTLNELANCFLLYMNDETNKANLEKHSSYFLFQKALVMLN